MSESDWKVVRTDEHPVLDEKDIEIMRLRAALEQVSQNKGMTLIGCSPDCEYGVDSTPDQERAHELGAYKAFNQCAAIADAALEPSK